MGTNNINNTKPEIEPGVRVGLKRVGKNEDVTTRLQGWIGAYGRGPFLVCGMIDNDHVSLEDKNGKLVHFGSTADPSLHIGYVELWQP